MTLTIEASIAYQMNSITYLSLFSAISFLSFGLACFITPQMKAEFQRYGLGAFRKTVGGLQIIGALGLLAGISYFPQLLPLAAAGLCVLMLLGFAVRLKIRDSILQSAPSLLYALLNAYILYYSVAVWTY